ncbi:MAG: HAMP domain-containing histidine kinase [Dehalococcoidales bacterium]|nr:HAMP domain-containing histidine kinase [Dehalococcoidales bacterium]
MKNLMGSLRWRLFFIYLIMALVILVIAGFLVYNMVQSRLINNRLMQTDELVSWALSNTEPQESLRVDDLNQIARNLSITPGPDFSFFLLDVKGELIQPLGQGNPGFAKTDFSTEDLYSITEGNEPLRIISKPEGYPFRVMTIIWPVLNSSGSLVGMIQSEVRLDEADEALSVLRLTLIVGFTSLLIITSGLWFIMTGAVVRPLIDMARVSRMVSDGDFSRRMVVAKSRNEIYYTISAFNKMLDSVQDSIAREKEVQVKTRQFMADASHELRSPVTVLKGFVDVLQRGARYNPEELKHALDNMSLSLNKITHLINDMLKLSQLEAVTALNVSTIDLNSLCLSSAEAAQVIAEDRQIEFLPGSSLMIKCDERLLEQALWNLLENSIRHTSPGGKIQVMAASKDGKAVITVRDNGEGIAPEHLSRIFERFYRVNKENQTGTGLGLSITKAIISKHSGEISVQSTPDVGTTFIIRLPLAE